MVSRPQGWARQSTFKRGVSVPYALYKLIHLSGIFVLLTVVAMLVMPILRGGTRDDHPRRRILYVVHGVASFFVLLGGFGMLARLGIVSGGLPGWIIAKLAIWVLLTGAILLPYRSASTARLVMVAQPALAVVAAAIALYKPF